ncbi:glycosyltransferase family 4 protein [Micrococcus lylae]|uniref:glycosyltransferase family 4 protein n=1 Tax=Micrococcus lylae TaxID=1273 RepID=UPI0021559334|nr:glycosyltransferase family 4 protein [Micrococcus lylae]WIK82377.1 glycosyltransferase family 4 protein [Micrococcus lylae]
MAFLVALNRDRDSYQVPAALAETGNLGRFVTDYYHGKPGHFLPSLTHRRHPSIPARSVVTSTGAFLAQLPYEAARRVRPTDFPSDLVESALGRTAARVARREPDLDLLLYSGSARQAFEGPSRGRRVLFQYHPSPGFIEETLRDIDELADLRPWWEEAEVGNASMEAKHRAEVAAADHAICASDFTRRGLLLAGLAPDAVSVVPYGCPAPAASGAQGPGGVQQFLFVGQGVQRKGLHILIEAWKVARVGDATLTVVASRLDPQIEELAAGVPRLTIRGRAEDTELSALMDAADALVLPSLVEGFGLVLGEALAHGCRLIASTNTGLPSMGLPGDLGRVVEAGRVQPLVDALEAFHHSFDPERTHDHRARLEAQRLSWAGFRAGIRRAVGEETT